MKGVITALVKVASMQWGTLVKRKGYYFNVFMSGDLTGLCLYIHVI